MASQSAMSVACVQRDRQASDVCSSALSASAAQASASAASVAVRTSIPGLRLTHAVRSLSIHRIRILRQRTERGIGASSPGQRFSCIGRQRGVGSSSGRLCFFGSLSLIALGFSFWAADLASRNWGGERRGE